MPRTTTAPTTPLPNRHPWLDRIERLGNRLPDPVALFGGATLLVMLLSQIAVWGDWRVTKTALVAGQPQQVGIQAVGLLDADGLWWLLDHLIDNFVRFPPLGLVLVGILGIGVAERSGLIGALLSRLLRLTPARLLTPMTTLIGILSSIALDAGYVVLPPLAAALYLAAGRSPLTGIAVVTAGVTAGFSANLFLTGLDPLLAGFTTAGAGLVDDGFRLQITANWWFMIASTLLLTLVAWGVTHRLVEPRTPPLAGPPDTLPGAADTRALGIAGAVFAATLAAILAMTLIPGGPLHGQGTHFPRWMEAAVPLLLILFLGPGWAFGAASGGIRDSRDLARMMGDTLKALGPYIVLAFFAAQFIALFNHSRLGEMLAIAGGQLLLRADLPEIPLLLGFVLLVMGANLFIGSASAKYAFLAPVFVPMFMQIGIGPALTQAAYRIGDSVSNGITPMNPYLIIVLMALRRYAPEAGLGTLFSLMLPYTLAFLVAWSCLLAGWMAMDWPLGPGGDLHYQTPSG